MSKPEISISTCFDYNVPIDRQIPLISETGFTHVSLGQDEKHSGISSAQRRSRLKALLGKYNLKIDTIHSVSLNNPESRTRLEKTIAAASDLEAPVVVVHPVPFEIEASVFQENLTAIMKTLEEIEPVLRKEGVKIAIENVMPGPATELAVQAINRMDPEYFGFCYDSAHEQIGGPRPFTLLDSLKESLIAVHLSDRVKEFVDHVPPGEGFINWVELASMLRQTTFNGPLLFEVMVEHSSVKETEPFLKLVYERACYVHSLLQKES